MKTKISNYKSVQEQHFLNETIVDSTEDEKFIVNLYIIIYGLNDVKNDDFVFDIENYGGTFTVSIKENSPTLNGDSALCVHTKFLNKDTCISYLKSAMINEAKDFLERAEQIKSFGISI